VREAVSEKAAVRIAGLKKAPMAKAAEKLLKDAGWLPQCLRTPHADDVAQYIADGMNAEAACSIAAE
jgi:ParB family chromosome partitioning protein